MKFSATSLPLAVRAASRSYLVLDLETWAPGWDGAAPPILQQVLCAGSLLVRVGPDRGVLVGDVEVACVDAPGSLAERGLVESCARALAPEAGLVLAGWNVRAFDLAVLACAAARLGVPAPHLVERDLADRYRGGRCLDLMDRYALRGVSRFASLDAAARAFGAPPSPASGADVAELARGGDLAAVVAHCRDDVLREALLLVAWLVLVGDVDVEAGARARAGLIERMTR